MAGLEREMKWGPTLSFRGIKPVTSRPPTKPHLFQMFHELGSKSLIPGPWEGTLESQTIAVGLGRGLGVCTSKKLPGDMGAARFRMCFEQGHFRGGQIVMEEAWRRQAGVIIVA
jgi:hypothetical protein